MASCATFSLATGADCLLFSVRSGTDSLPDSKPRKPRKSIYWLCWARERFPTSASLYEPMQLRHSGHRIALDWLASRRAVDIHAWPHRIEIWQNTAQYLGSRRYRRWYFCSFALAYFAQSRMQRYRRTRSNFWLLLCVSSAGADCLSPCWPRVYRARMVYVFTANMALLALAFFWAYRTGQWKHENKPLTVKKHGRKRKSIFRYGLDELQHTIKNFTVEKNDFIKSLELLYGT